MDAIVHVLYEIAGTTGAFTSPTLVGKFGYNYSALFSPLLFALAALIWRFVSNVETLPEGTNSRLADLEREETKHGYLWSIWVGFRSFGKATYYGAMLVGSHRKYVWLITGYSMALYGHRYLENGLAPIFARQVLGVSSWSQIIVGGSK